MKTPWLNILAVCIGAFYFVMLTGCHVLPTFHAPSVSAHSAGNDVAAGGSILKPKPASTVAEVAHGQAILFSVLGVLLILGGVALCYFQFYFPAIKLFAAGVILPVVGIIWSEHYAIILTLGLVALAAWYLFTHHAVTSAIIKQAGSDVEGALDEIKGIASIAASKTTTPAAPAQPNTAKPV